MDISILVGANCAAVRMKVNGKTGNDLTRVKFFYRKETDTEYAETNEYYVQAYGTTYGYGPFFYDLNGLEPETKYYIKMVVTNVGGLETQEKSFTTCKLGVFEFNDTGYFDTDNRQNAYFTLLENFRAKMIGVGYDYIVFGERTLPENSKYLDENGGLSAKVYCDSRKVGDAAAVTVGGYMGKIYLSPGYTSSDTLLHEYRHFSGLVYSGYHGDIMTGPKFANFPEYSSNISKVVNFARGGDGENFEIYMYNRENSIDDRIIPRMGGKNLGFFLIKALGLNDIDIVY